nr:hypothetical protein CFP56_02664 [Quercus suber]
MDRHVEMHWHAMKTPEHFQETHSPRMQAQSIRVQMIPTGKVDTSFITDQMFPANGPTRQPLLSPVKDMDDSDQPAGNHGSLPNGLYPGSPSMASSTCIEMSSILFNCYNTTDEWLYQPISCSYLSAQTKLWGNDTREPREQCRRKQRFRYREDDVIPWAYQDVLQNRIHTYDLGSGAKYDIAVYSPIFIYDCLMLPGSLANILDGKVRLVFSSDSAYTLTH